MSTKGSKAKLKASGWVCTSSYNVAVWDTRYLSTSLLLFPVEQAPLEVVKSESGIVAEISCHCLWESLLALHLHLDGGDGGVSEHPGERLEKGHWTELQGSGCGCPGVCPCLSQPGAVPGV